MKKGLLAIAILLTFNSFAGPGDTTWVQTFTFDTINTRRAVFSFPDETKDYRKVLMYYRLKCDPKTTRDQYDCGEWDYLTYTYVYDHTGKMDSTPLTHVNYIVNGTTPDNYDFSLSRRWNAYKRTKTIVDYLDQNSLSTASIGTGTGTASNIIMGSALQSRTQFIWDTSELNTAGLIANQDITGIRLGFSSAAGNEVRLRIRMRNNTTGIGAGNVDNGAFTTVYDQPFSTNDTGEHLFKFSNNFQWDGSSNVLVEILCDNPYNNGQNYVIKTETTAGITAVYNNDNNYFLDFEGADAVIFPDDDFSSITDEITVSLWCFGDPDLQPQQNYTFEASGSDGTRMINSHLPWGNGQVYWDAGGVGGSYDRINKAANASAFKGKWNHWAFTKDVNTGTMRIFLNGALWHSGTGKNRVLSGIKDFVLGSRRTGPANNGAGSYDGYVDEFTVWNKALSAGEINGIMNNGVSNSHPSYSSLQYYYKFDEKTGNMTLDYSSNGNTATMLGTPGRVKSMSEELIFGYTESSERPNIVFEQGDFDITTSTISYYDTLDMPMSSVIIYGDLAEPTVPTDTLWGWDAGYSYVYDENGTLIDSVQVKPTRSFAKVENPYFSDPFEVVNRFEIARYITPYGKGLDLGPNGFLWMFDVTDYQDLLRGQVDLAAHNRQELIDLKFAFIEGTPARNPKSIRNVYVGNPTFSTNFESWAVPKKVYINPDAERTVVKFRLTGHGFGGNENCAEFCKKDHWLDVDGERVWKQNVWRDNCAFNPVQPQGGTWVYQRANWCPGAEVETYEVDITDQVTRGDSVELDYSAEAYTWNGSGSRPYYKTEIQIMEFDGPKFDDDASLELILNPNSDDLYRRHNPICNNPRIIIRNTGNNNLTSLDIYFGVEGGLEQYTPWVGNLGFMEQDTITLTQPIWDGVDLASPRFTVRLEYPNGKIDENPLNDKMTSNVELVARYEPFYVELRTNNNPQENRYVISDQDGNVVFVKENMAPNTLYRDTFNLPNGCYKFQLMDYQENGLSWWAATAQGSGYCRIRKVGTFKLYENFNSDFGGGVEVNFVVGKMDLPEQNFRHIELKLYPNPSNGVFLLDLPNYDAGIGKLRIYDALGRIVYKDEFDSEIIQTKELDLTNHSKGTYYLEIELAGTTELIKMVLTN
jgi:hypothetical protein